MKKLLLLALLAFPFLAKAQLVQSAEYSWRVQICDLTYDLNGQLTACPVTVFYQSTITNSGVFVANVPSVPQTLSVDLVKQATSTVVYQGTTYTYGQALGIMNAIFAQERAAELAAANAPKAPQTAQVLSTPSQTNNEAPSGNAQASSPILTTNNVAITSNNASITPNTTTP